MPKHKPPIVCNKTILSRPSTGSPTSPMGWTPPAISDPGDISDVRQQPPCRVRQQYYPSEEVAAYGSRVGQTNDVADRYESTPQGSCY